MNKRILALPITALAILLTSCKTLQFGDVKSDLRVTEQNYELTATSEVILTAESGEKLAPQENVSFSPGYDAGNVIVIRPDIRKQEIDGIGSSFTESSAFVLAHLEPEKRKEVMHKIYSEDGANFSMARTVIGSTDFSVEGKFSYADVKGDKKLKHFSLGVDKDGFSTENYPGIKDTSFDLLPMIKEAQAIKSAQDDSTLSIVASAWTAPSWMKDIETWFIPLSAENNWQGTGGVLKEQYVQTYADYLARYLAEYKKEGIDIWGMTPVNEPHGNSGQWESMHFSPESQNDFVKKYMGPTLHAAGFEDVNVLVYDQNRDHMMEWADAIIGDSETAKYVHGIGVHWYASTFKVFEDEMNEFNEAYPDFAIIHTEGTIDNLGVEAPLSGIMDRDGYQEENWFDNDEFWWNKTASDWAYSAEWAGPAREDHPLYVPVHRYARNIIVSLNNWMTGWIDWNVVLDAQGGPNHVGNFCGAPIMIDTETGYVYYTPIYHVMAQLSRTIRPGDTAVQAYKYLDGLDEDTLHASATVSPDNLMSVQVLNTSKEPVDYALQVGGQHADVTIPANSLQTLRFQL